MSTHNSHKKSDKTDENHVDQPVGLLTKSDRQMFMELGFTASSNFLPWEGHALFSQLMLAEPEEAYPRLGLAYCKIMGGQFEDAHNLLKNKIVLSSKLKDYGNALRGLAFHLEKKPQELDELFNSNKNSLQENSTAYGFFQILLTSLP
ncbi:MAG: hypothetical protein DVB29_06240 [Verrucomicrobia bacterium]|nr:MAG: hypothetical protein DVB29_06240 [Verrucomicrobiota bacterium]